MRRNRRQWMHDTACTVTGLSAAILGPPGAAQDRHESRQAEGDDAATESAADIPAAVDVNAHLGRWPFRRLPLQAPGRLVAKLRSLGFAGAWVASFEALLHRDLASVNARLAQTCRQVDDDFLRPVGAINPVLADWREDLRRCAEVHAMAALRVYPAYHGLTLTDRRFVSLVAAATEYRLPIQLVVALEDVRTQHPLVRVDDVDLAPLPDLLQQYPTARFMLLGARPRGQSLERLADCPAIHFETSRLEATDGLAQLVQRVTAERVSLGTHAPLLVPEANLIKLYESQLSVAELSRVMAGSAADWLARAGGER